MNLERLLKWVVNLKSWEIFERLNLTVKVITIPPIRFLSEKTISYIFFFIRINLCDQENFFKIRFVFF